MPCTPTAAAVVALDFDGVLCDSARETALSAWRAGRECWPDWTAPLPPAEYVQRFVRLRPWLETGYQAIVMLRMIADGLPDTAFAEHLEEHCQHCLAGLGCRRSDLVARFAAARDAWIASDLPGWLATHTFYPGVVAALRRAQAEAEVYILTTKQERFAAALLAGQGLRLPADRLFGLDRGRAKEDILAELVAAWAAGTVHFVEDRAETLRRVVAVRGLAGVRLYYAGWGYGTPADLAWASAEPRVRVWELAEFLRLE